MEVGRVHSALCTTFHKSMKRTVRCENKYRKKSSIVSPFSTVGRKSPSHSNGNRRRNSANIIFRENDQNSGSSEYLNTWAHATNCYFRKWRDSTEINFLLFSPELFCCLPSDMGLESLELQSTKSGLKCKGKKGKTMDCMINVDAKHSPQQLSSHCTANRDDSFIFPILYFKTFSLNVSRFPFGDISSQRIFIECNFLLQMLSRFYRNKRIVWLCIPSADEIPPFFQFFLFSVFWHRCPHLRFTNRLRLQLALSWKLFKFYCLKGSHREISWVSIMIRENLFEFRMFSPENWH